MPQLELFDPRVVLSSARYEVEPGLDRFDRTQLIAALVGAQQRVLELGCSTGFISRALKKSACHVVGVEIDPLAAEAAAKICDQVLVADLELPDWMNSVNDKFDVILLGDVLEHLVAPQDILRSLRSLLVPHGHIVVSLPNVVHWTQRLKILFGRFQYQSVGILDFTHLRFFDQHSAYALIESSGYEIESFLPVIGGRFSRHLRALWQFLANLTPGLFAYQFLIKARLREPLPETRSAESPR